MVKAIETSVFELLLETGKAITSEVEQEKLVQKITDIGTEISGAQFGALFYNVINQKGENYFLYTISGVPKEAFSKFPMPRKTEVFHPTFTGLCTVRYDDVTQESHYGKSAPHFGMPRGHLPVKSYLATPVISPITKEVIGGLFFGHPEAGVFTERSEKLIEGIAAQAAVAMGNARLFEEKKKTEEILKEQREQYKSIFQSATDAMIIFDDQGKAIEANPAATALFGYSLEKIKTLEGRDIFPHTEQFFNAIEDIVRSGRRYKGIGDLQTQKGIVTVQIVGSHYILKGKIHTLLLLKPVSSEKQIEEALIKSENFGQTIANISPVTLWMTNEKGQTIYVNQTWLEMVGGKMEDHMQKGWIRSIVEEDRWHAESSFVTAFESKRIFTTDFRIRRRDGAIRWCSSYGSPYYLPNGKFGGYAGSLTDITDRKEAEEKLASQHTLINTLTNNTLHALFLMDDQQWCTYMNPAAEQMTGYTIKEVQEKPLHYYIHHTHTNGNHFPIEECLIDRALPEKMQTQGEETFIRKNGEFFPVSFVASPIIENGIPVGTVIEVRETTEEKKIREELRNKEKEYLSVLEHKVKERTAELEKINYELMQFTSVASHDLKEPVRKVSIFSERSKELAKDFDNPQFHQYMDNVINSSKRMALLIDDLLHFSRLSQERFPLKDVNLGNLLDHIKDDLQLAISEKEAVVNVGKLPTMKGIELQLGQVFLNLISNSLKFSHENRRPEINISCVSRQDEYLIRYTDNGIGFNNEMSTKIFDIFERLHPREEYEGTGIGLAIVKKIITLHGGEITASSIAGEGSEFTIVLPKNPAPYIVLADK